MYILVSSMYGNYSFLPCLLLLMIPILVGSDFGWLTAMGAVLVMVVMVAAGIIRVDIIQHYSIDISHQWIFRTEFRTELLCITQV